MINRVWNYLTNGEKAISGILVISSIFMAGIALIAIAIA